MGVYVWRNQTGQSTGPLGWLGPALYAGQAAATPAIFLGVPPILPISLFGLDRGQTLLAISLICLVVGLPMGFFVLRVLNSVGAKWMRALDL